MISVDNLPKSYIFVRDEEGNEIKQFEVDEEGNEIVEFELPDFVALADEILEAEIEAEFERIRILNKTPVEVLCPR